MHQNKPIAPVTYLNSKAKKVTVEGFPTQTYPFDLTLAEIAILQTLTNRSATNCQCNLNKDVMNSIVEKIKDSIRLYDGEKQ